MYGRPDDRTAALLDREAPLPLYAQLRDALLREVRAGGLQPGDRFPSEVEIRDRYGVSRATVRQALGELEADGVIRRVQGLGSFVASPKIRHLPLLKSFSELAAGQGFAPSHRLLASALEDAPAELGRATPCRYLRRLLLADGKPVGLSETWLPVDALGGHDALVAALGDGSMYELLRHEPIALVLDHAEETISPGAADAESAALLGCAPGTAVLLIRRLTYTPEGLAVVASVLADVTGPEAPLAPSAEVAVGADHGGYRLKERIAADLRGRGVEVYDFGTDSTESVDYPDFAHRVARAVADGGCRWGIVVDGAGIGSAIAANKVPGVRAATCWDVSSARNSREHNHANVLVLGAGLLGENLALEIVHAWLETPWGRDRHARRVAKITEIERRYLAAAGEGATA